MKFVSSEEIRIMRAQGRAIIVVNVADYGGRWCAPCEATMLGVTTMPESPGIFARLGTVVEYPPRIRGLGRLALRNIAEPPADHPCNVECHCLEIRRSA